MAVLTRSRLPNFSPSQLGGSTAPIRAARRLMLHLLERTRTTRTSGMLKTEVNATRNAGTWITSKECKTRAAATMVAAGVNWDKIHQKTGENPGPKSPEVGDGIPHDRPGLATCL